MLRTVETEQAVAIPEFPVLLDPLARLIQHFPDIALRFLVDLVYPYPLLPTCDGEQRRLIQSLYQRFSLDTDVPVSADEAATPLSPWTNYRLLRIERHGAESATMHAVFALEGAASSGADTGTVPMATVRMSSGTRPSVAAEFFVDTLYHTRIQLAMLQTHAVGDFCLIGPKGVGKSALVRQFARSLGCVLASFPESVIRTDTR